MSANTLVIPVLSDPVFTVKLNVLPFPFVNVIVRSATDAVVILASNEVAIEDDVKVNEPVISEASCIEDEQVLVYLLVHQMVLYLH